MTQRLYGNRFIFSSRDNSNIIRLSADVGETLLIDGYTPGSGGSGGSGLGATNTITTGRSDVSNPSFSLLNNITYSNTTTARNNGTSTNIVDVGDDAWLISGCPTNPSSALGGVAIYKSTNGQNFVEKTLLVNQTFTTLGFFGKTCSIDSTGTLVAFTNGQASNPIANIYRRVDDTWSFVDEVNDCYYFKNYGTKAIVSTYYNVVKAYVNSGGDNWIAAQTLTISTTAVEADTPYVDIWENTLVFANQSDESIRQFDHDGSSWISTTTITKNATEGIITGLSMKKNVLVFCTPETVYICIRTNSTNPFVKTQEIPATAGTFTSCSVSLKGLVGYGTSGYLAIRIKSDELVNNWDVLRETNSSNISSLASSDNFTIAGKSTFELSTVFKNNFLTQTDTSILYLQIYNFTTAVTALYLITSEIVFDANGYGGSREVHILVDGVIVSKSSCTGDLVRPTCINNAITLSITAGKPVSLKTYQSSGHLVVINSGRFSRVKLNAG